MTLWLLACGPVRPSDTDASLDSLPQPATVIVSFNPSGPRMLAPGQRVRLALMVTDLEGRPVNGVDVRLALIGDTHDASLLETRLISGTSVPGHAETVLVASQSAATFRVRATTVGVTSGQAFADVSVSGRGFGGLRATAVYSGERAPTEIELRLFAGSACAAASPQEPVRTATVPVPGAIVTFTALGAEQTFSLRANALSSAGVILATACEPTINPVLDRTIDVTLDFVDLPLEMTGTYAFSVQWELEPLASMQATAVLDEMNSAVRPAVTDVDAMLASIGAAVEAQSGHDARVAFDSAASATLKQSIVNDLRQHGGTPVEAMTDLIHEAAVVARTVRSDFRVFAAPRAGEDVLLTLQQANIGLDPLTPDVTGDDAQFLAPIVEGMGVGRATVQALPRDRVNVSLDAFPFPLQLILYHAVNALLVRYGADSVEEWASIHARCGRVEELVRGYTASCGASCVTAACSQSVNVISSALNAAINRRPSTHLAASIQFSAVAIGEPATLRVQSAERVPLQVARYVDDATPLAGTVTVTTPP